MGAFDLPPSTPPVSFDPPPSPRRRSAGRTAAVAAASVALIAAGVLAVAQFASGADDDVANAAQGVDSTPATPAPETTPPPSTTAPADDAPDATQELDGKIVIQIGDGEPIVIDLGELGELGELGDLGELGSLPPSLGDLGDLGKIQECIGDFGDLPFDISIDAPGLDVFGDGDDITIAGPDGVSILDFGDGDGSVTITKQDGEITISPEGDVQVNDLADVFGSLPDEPPTPPSLPDFDEIYQCFEDASG